MPPSPNNIEETVELVNRLFPFTSNEDLKAYAILSVRPDLVNLINDKSVRMMIVGAYTLDEALRANKSLLDSYPPSLTHLYTLPSGWRAGVMTCSLPYQQFVPLHKIGEMVTKIRASQIPPKEEKAAAGVAELEAHARYIFDRAEASAYEKGILTGVINRFRSKLTDTTTKSNGTA